MASFVFRPPLPRQKNNWIATASKAGPSIYPSGIKDENPFGAHTLTPGASAAIYPSGISTFHDLGSAVAISRIAYIPSSWTGIIDNGAATIVMPAFGVANTAANRLVLLVIWTDSVGTGGDSPSVTDSKGNTWNQVGSTYTTATNYNGTDYYRGACFEVLSCIGGINTPSVHFTSSGSSVVEIFAAGVEITGSKPGVSSYSFTGNYTTEPPGTTSSSVTMTPVNSGDMLVGITGNPDNDDITGVISGNTLRGSILPSGAYPPGPADLIWSELISSGTSPQTVGATLASSEYWGAIGVVIPQLLPPSSTTSIYPSSIKADDPFGNSSLTYQLTPTTITSKGFAGNSIVTITNLVYSSGLNTQEVFGAIAASTKISSSIITEERPTSSILQLQLLNSSIATFEVFGVITPLLSLHSIGIFDNDKSGFSSTSLSLLISGIISEEKNSNSALIPSIVVSGVEAADYLGTSTTSISLYLSSLSSEEKEGSCVVTPNIIPSLAVAGINGQENFGSSTTSLKILSVSIFQEFVSSSNLAANILAHGFASQEQIGSSLASLRLTPIGIPTLQQVGAFATQINIFPSSLINSEVLGSSILANVQYGLLYPGALFSEEIFGSSITSINVFGAEVDSFEIFVAGYANMVNGRINADVDAFWSYSGDGAAIYPLPDSSINPNISFPYADPCLYTVATYLPSILTSNLLPRFAEDMLKYGISHANLDNYVDGVAVAQTIFHRLHPSLLSTTSYFFPLVSIVEVGQNAIQFTHVKPGVQRNFQISFVMPPLNAPQANIFAYYQSIISKIWMAFGAQGYDPKINEINAWQKAGVSFGSMGQVDFLPFLGQQQTSGAKKYIEAFFPAVTINLSVVERNQLGLVQNYPDGEITSVFIQENLIDGYSPANAIDNFVDGYVYPQITITNANPNNGSITGYKSTYLVGTGFTSQIAFVSLCGVPVQSFTIKRQNLMLIISNPGITTGTGDIVITDRNNNTYTFVNGYSYT